MTAFLDRVPVETISVRARQARPGRTVLAMIASVLFAAGWLAAQLLRVAWLALAWSAVAVNEGWRQAGSGNDAGRSRAG